MNERNSASFRTDMQNTSIEPVSWTGTLIRYQQERREQEEFDRRVGLTREFGVRSRGLFAGWFRREEIVAELPIIEVSAQRHNIITVENLREEDGLVIATPVNPVIEAQLYQDQGITGWLLSAANTALLWNPIINGLVNSSRPFAARILSENNTLSR